MPELIVLFLGSVDEEYLMGKKVQGSEKETEMGVEFDRQGGFRKELTNMQSGHLFWNNRISDVTDQESLNGPKFLQSFPG